MFSFGLLKIGKFFSLRSSYFKTILASLSLLGLLAGTCRWPTSLWTKCTQNIQSWSRYGLTPQNYRWQNRKECKEKTNWAQSALAQRVRCTASAPLPLDSTPTQSCCCTGLAAPTDHPPFVSISRLLKHSSLRCDNSTLRKRRRRHHTFLFCHL